LHLAVVIQTYLTDSPVRLILAGVCIGLGISTLLLAEALRRFGPNLRRDVDAAMRSGETNNSPPADTKHGR
jgi:hypothetical protein